MGEFRQAPNQGATGHLDDQILSGLAIHALALPHVSILGDQLWRVILGDQVVEVMVSLQNDVAAAPPVASAGPAFGAVGFPMEGHASTSAFAGAGEHFDFVDKHEKKGEAKDLAREKMSEIF